MKTNRDLLDILLKIVAIIVIALIVLYVISETNYHRAIKEQSHIINFGDVEYICIPQNLYNRNGLTDE